MRVRSSPSRRALSLLEVIVSLAILLIALVAIGQLLNLGSQLAMDARHHQHAAFLCQSKLAEFTAGSLAFEQQPEAEFEDGGVTWLWQASCEQVSNDMPGLWRVEVQVYRDSPSGQRVVVALQQMIIDPNYVGSTFDPPPKAATEQPTEEMTEGSNSGNSSSGMGTTKTGG